MKYLFYLSLFLLMACNPQVDTTELTALKDKLATAEKLLAAAKVDQTAFIHTVFFWMKKEVTDKEKANFMKKGLADLAKVPSIYKVYYGPAAGTPREVVDNSYDAALVVHFKSSEEQDKYQVDPIHLKFIEDYKHLWDRVQVYDNLLSD